MTVDDKTRIKYLQSELEKVNRMKDKYRSKLSELLKEHKRLLDLYFS